MLYLGLISGTSMDAVDSALVEIEGDSISLVDFQEYPLPESIRTPLRAMTQDSPLQEVTLMDARIGELLAEAAQTLLRKNSLSGSEIVAIGSHGQTVFHSPESTPPCTLQIGDPNIIAARTGITTVADFRRMDMAKGGQGAPFAPLFHKAFFQTDYPRIVLNIGGIANITVLTENPEDPLTGFDTGPGNCLLDDWIQLHLGKHYDENGQWAKSGTVSDDLLNILLEDEYFTRMPPRSTGRDDFNLEWLQRQLDQLDKAIKPDDVQATLALLTVHSIKTAVDMTPTTPREILVCGGGANNPFLMEQLALVFDRIGILTTTEAGLDVGAVEASCFAWLGCQRINKIPLDLKSLTGATGRPCLGAVYENPALD